MTLTVVLATLKNCTHCLYIYIYIYIYYNSLYNKTLINLQYHSPLEEHTQLLVYILFILYLVIIVVVVVKHKIAVMYHFKFELLLNRI